MTKKQTAEEKKSLQIEIIKQMITLSSSGFGLVAALAWNNVIQEFVKNYITKWLPQGGLMSLFIYALVITILAVIVTYQLSKLLKTVEKEG